MNLTLAVESLLFASESPVKLAELVKIFAHEELVHFGADELILQETLASLISKYSSDAYAFEVREIAGGYQFLTKPAYGLVIRTLLVEKDRKRLSRASLETLSIIAYRQPISKAEIEYIRGVNCEYAMQKLLEKQLIEAAGRSDAPGKPMLYRTSAYFMEYFGISSLKDLPKLQEIPADEEAYHEQFRNEFREEPETENQFFNIRNTEPETGDPGYEPGLPEREAELPEETQQ